MGYGFQGQGQTDHGAHVMLARRMQQRGSGADRVPQQRQPIGGNIGLSKPGTEGDKPAFM